MGAHAQAAELFAVLPTSDYQFLPAKEASDSDSGNNVYVSKNSCKKMAERLSSSDSGIGGKSAPLPKTSKNTQRPLRFHVASRRVDITWPKTGKYLIPNGDQRPTALNAIKPIGGSPARVLTRRFTFRKAPASLTRGRSTLKIKMLPATNTAPTTIRPLTNIHRTPTPSLTNACRKNVLGLPTIAPLVVSVVQLSLWIGYISV